APQESYRNNGPPVSAPAPIIMVRQAAIAAEDRTTRVWRRQLPAWIISGGLHVALVVAFLGAAGWGPRDDVSAAPAEETIIETKVEDAPTEKQNFENTDVGTDPSRELTINVERLETVAVPGQFRPDEPIGIA